MEKQQQYGLDALIRVQAFLDSNGVALGALVNTPARAQLNAAVSHATSNRAQQDSASLDATGQLSQQRQAVTVLRQAHMQPIAKFARANLTGVPDFAKLTKTGNGLRGAALVAAARAMATAAAPYAARLTEAQFPSDALQELAAAADAVETAISDRSGSKVVRIAATAGIKQALSEGRQAVEMLDPVVTKMLAGNDGLLAGWRAAKRIVAKPGVIRPSSGVTPSPAPVTPTPTVPPTTIGHPERREYAPEVHAA